MNRMPRKSLLTLDQIYPKCFEDVQVAREYQLHPTMINRWRREHIRYAEHAFSGNGSSVKSETRVAELERMVGQLTMENPPVGGLKKALLRLESRLRVGNGAGER